MFQNGMLVFVTALLPITVNTQVSSTSTTSTAASVTSKASTAAPVTSNTSTAAPVISTTSTAAPVTSTTSTAAPVTSNPSTAAPVTSNPSTTAPVTSNPSTTAPVTSNTSTAAPVTSNPSTAAPVTSNSSMTPSTPMAPPTSTTTTPLASTTSTTSTPSTTVPSTDDCDNGTSPVKVVRGKNVTNATDCEKENCNYYVENVVIFERDGKAWIPVTRDEKCTKGNIVFEVNRGHFILGKVNVKSALSAFRMHVGFDECVTEMVVEIPIVDDCHFESNEVFDLTLSEPDPGTVAKPKAKLKVLDDDFEYINK